MYVWEPHSLTEMYIDHNSRENISKGLLNANFQDYMDSLAESGRLQIKSGKLKQKISAMGSALGIAAGSLGGPAGMALGFALGSTIGKYAGNVASDKIFGQAISDINEISHDSKLRHAQLAAITAFEKQVSGAIDTLRQNENKRLKDDLQAMQV